MATLQSSEHRMAICDTGSDQFASTTLIKDSLEDSVATVILHFNWPIYYANTKHKARASRQLSRSEKVSVKLRTSILSLINALCHRLKRAQVYTQPSPIELLAKALAGPLSIQLSTCLWYHPTPHDSLVPNGGYKL